MPTENHPSKSHESSANKTRRHIDIVKDHQVQEKVAYQNIEHLKRGFEKSALKDWTRILSETSIILKFSDPKFDVPKYVVSIEENLTFYIAVYNWKLPEDHEIYRKNTQSMKSIKVAQLLHDVSEQGICQGIPNQLSGSECICHMVPKALDMKAAQPFQSETFYRSKSCRVCNILPYRFLSGNNSNRAF